MFKFLSAIVIMAFSFTSLSAFHIDSIVDNTVKPSKKRTSTTTQHLDKFFAATNAPLSGEFIATNPYYLLQAAQDTLNFLHTTKGRANTSQDPEHFKNLLPREKVESTLKFIVSTIKHDMTSGKFRILDPDFLNKNFHFIRWNADSSGARNNGIRLSSDGNIRLTSYAIFNVRGSPKKTPAFPCAIYQALDAKISKQYTKQQVLSGILEKPENKKRIKALAWLSRDDFEDALMQGTIIVKLPNKECVFVANLCNEIAYDKMETDPRHQKRFWYFKESKNSKWTIEQLKKRLKSRQNVIFAGDISNIGVGKIIAIKHPNPVTGKSELRLGVLADTGGAFVQNLYQLDLFAGIFNSRTELSSYLKHIPVRAQAYILYR